LSQYTGKTEAAYTYLGIYRTLSATTKPTVTTRFAAGRKGRTTNRLPSSKGGCFCCWKQATLLVVYFMTPSVSLQ
jgi:hypothetical protein